MSVAQASWQHTRVVSLDAVNGTQINVGRVWIGNIVAFNAGVAGNLRSITIYDDASADGAPPAAGNLRFTIALQASNTVVIPGSWRFDNGIKVLASNNEAVTGVTVQFMPRIRTE